MSDEFIPQYPNRFLLGDDIPNLRDVKVRLAKFDDYSVLEVRVEIDLPIEERFMAANVILQPGEMQATRVIHCLIDCLTGAYHHVEKFVHEKRATEKNA